MAEELGVMLDCVREKVESEAGRDALGPEQPARGGTQGWDLSRWRCGCMTST
jgi:hypothetical protein